MRRSHSLRVSPALHPPKRPSPRRANKTGHGLRWRTKGDIGADKSTAYLKALVIEAAKSPFSNPLLNGDCSYNDQCSVLSKTAFVQIGPQSCKQVQKQTRRVWEWSFIDNFCKLFGEAKPRRAQRARSRIESGERSESARCANPKR